MAANHQNYHKELTIDKVQMREYLSNIVKKMDDFEAIKGLTSKYCTLDILKDTPK
jgi:hypothetical protein